MKFPEVTRVPPEATELTVRRLYVTKRLTDKFGTTLGNVRVYKPPSEQILKKEDVLQAGTYRINLRTIPKRFGSNVEYRQSLRAAREANNEQTKKLEEKIDKAKEETLQEVGQRLKVVQETLLVTQVD